MVLCRLIGSEPHPVKDNADLLTYLCSTCGEFSYCLSKAYLAPDDMGRLNSRRHFGTDALCSF